MLRIIVALSLSQEILDPRMKLPLFSLAAIGFAIQLASAAQVVPQDTGRTLALGDISYFLPPAQVAAFLDSDALSAAVNAKAIWDWYASFTRSHNECTIRSHSSSVTW